MALASVDDGSRWATGSVRGYRVDVQATVRSHDATTGSGTVLTDDGVLLHYDGNAFAASGLRHLRLGQRVRIEVEGDGESLAVSSIALYTM